MKILILIFSIVICNNLMARDLRVKFVHPTEREDNTPLKPEEIKQFNMYYGSKSGDYQSSLVINAGATEVLISSLPDTDLYLVLTTVDTEGRESVYSNEVFSEFSIDKPSAPDTIVIEL